MNARKHQPVPMTNKKIAPAAIRFFIFLYSHCALTDGAVALHRVPRWLPLFLFQGFEAVTDGGQLFDSHLHSVSNIRGWGDHGDVHDPVHGLHSEIEAL